MSPHIDLNAFLSGHVFAFMLIFTRVAAVMMLFPGIGEPYVPPRTRLMFAFLISFLLLGPLFPRLPAMPAQPAEMTRMIAYEMIIGLFFGTMIRLLTSVLESTGFIVGAQTGLSNATIMNPALATQSPLSSAFLSTSGMVLIFVTGADHFLIRSIAALYDAFPAGGDFMPGDMAQTIIHLTNNSFTLGIELSAPFLIMGLLMYAALGLMQRLMPSIQLFMVALPIQIWGGLLMLMLTVAAILGVWLHYFDDQIASFLQK
ncbi:MAG: flagellar biosynthetic protein FliR [Alphaproteobacteria bacterium]|nr:flagellar biosynthetic protein FliR [Alphaproteobacteria bacterium]